MGMTLASLSPFIARTERLHGQGTLTYGALNSVLTENVPGQSAPDPVRYGDTPARPSRRTMAFMQLNIRAWNYGLAGDFAASGAHDLTRRIMPAGRQTNIRAQNSVGVRPNISRPPAIAYGSLFALKSSIYDLTG